MCTSRPAKRTRFFRNDLATVLQRDGSIGTVPRPKRTAVNLQGFRVSGPDLILTQYR